MAAIKGNAAHQHEQYGPSDGLWPKYKIQTWIPTVIGRPPPPTHHNSTVRSIPRSGASACQHKQFSAHGHGQITSELGVNKNNLVMIKCDHVHVQLAKKSLQVCCLNPRSIKNKALSLNDYIVAQDYDVVALTETWLGTSVDKKCIGELVPSGYTMKHAPRPGSRNGGGVALLYKSAISFRLHGSSTAGDYTNFEHIDCDLNMGDTTVRLAVVYRPPTSKYNGLTLPEFFEQWCTFLAGYTTHAGEMLWMAYAPGGVKGLSK